MRLRPPLSALLASTFAMVVLPAVALGLTLPPEDLVGAHAALDARLADAALPDTGDPAFDTPAVAPEPRRVHRVRPGESLASIAQAYGLDGIDDWRLLFDANTDLEHPDIVEPGTLLRIPQPGERLERRDLPAPVAIAAGRRGAASGDLWWRLAVCESGGQNRASANGRYFGYFQFMPATWHSVGGSGLPTEHSYGEQLRRAQILQSRAGWGQWPACARALGLR